jgi:hypothetical protein
MERKRESERVNEKGKQEKRRNFSLGTCLKVLNEKKQQK